MSPSNQNRSRLCSLERLESRDLLSAAAIPHVTAFPQAIRAAAVTGQAPYTPAQISHAYGLDQIKPLAGNVPDNERGQTIAIVDAYDDPTIRTDLQTFDGQFGLPNPTASSFTIVNQTGGKQLPPADPDWTIETRPRRGVGPRHGPGGKHPLG